MHLAVLNLTSTLSVCTEYNSASAAVLADGCLCVHILVECSIAPCRGDGSGAGYGSGAGDGP